MSTNTTTKVKLSEVEQLVLVKESQAKAVVEAREAVRLAKEKLMREEARLARIEAEAPHLVALAELAVKVAEHKAALKEIRSAAAPTPRAAHKPEAGPAPEKATSADTVTPAGGVARPLSREAVATLKGVIRRTRAGLLSPLEGLEASAVLQAVDEAGVVGDAFSVTLKGRKGRLVFEVVAEGLKYHTVTGGSE